MKQGKILVCFLLGATIAAFSPGARGDNALSNQITQLRPVRLGTSGGNIKDSYFHKSACCSGTLGALVEDDAGNFFLLSNNHVMARENRAHRGNIITQPGLVDVDCLVGPSNAVGTLTAFVSLKHRNQVDAALAKITSTNDVDITGTILNIGQPSMDTFVPPLGSVVMKSGRTTGVSSGVVAAIDATLTVAYDRCVLQRRLIMRTFTNQVIVTPANFGDFAAGGDSGSLVVEATNGCPRTVGLLFAGTSSATAVNPIHEVLAELGKKLRGASLHVVGCTSDSVALEVAKEQSRGLAVASYGKATVARINHEDKLLRTPGVVGIGVGQQQGDPSQATVEILVDKDTPELRAALPSSIDGVPCHILETGQFVAH